MKALVEIDLGNDAMQTAAEVGDAVNRALIQQSASALDPLRVGETGAVFDANGNTVGKWEITVDKLGILGRERALVDKLTKGLQEHVSSKHEYTAISRTPRGNYFEVRMFDGNESTDRVARVMVEFDRVEAGDPA